MPPKSVKVTKQDSKQDSKQYSKLDYKMNSVKKVEEIPKKIVIKKKKKNQSQK